MRTISSVGSEAKALLTEAAGECDPAGATTGAPSSLRLLAAPNFSTTGRALPATISKKAGPRSASGSQPAREKSSTASNPETPMAQVRPSAGRPASQHAQAARIQAWDTPISTCDKT